jgi:mRNA interferase RelE/StbE
MDSTVRYLGVDLDHALSLSEGVGLYVSCAWPAGHVAYSYIMKQISYTKAAIRVLRRMLANTAKLIRTKIEAYATDPASQANNVKSLKGREGIRLRVGDWRVIMDDQGNVLAVLDIGLRGGIYDRKGMT